MPPQETKRKRVQIVLPKFQVWFEHLMEPRKVDINNRPLEEKDWSYECMAVFDSVDQMVQVDKQRWQDMINAAKQVRDAFFEGNVPANYRSPLKSGTDYNTKHNGKYPALVGKTIINLKSKGQKVGIVDANNRRIIDPSAVYSGMYAIADGTWFGYNVGGGESVGLSFGLNNIMKVADGEPLGRVNNPEAAFREIDASVYTADNSGMFASAGATEDLI